MKPDRVVIGTEDARARETLRALYEPLVRTGGQILCVSTRSAELAKYAANAMLATRISFMNEVAELCEATGADVTEVRHVVGADARIGSAFLYAGVGFGGSCFPKDLREVAALGRHHGAVTGVADAVLVRNERQRGRLFERVWAHFGGSLAGRTVAVWGLSFKPETDDVREAPASDVVGRLLRAEAHVRTYDPVVKVPGAPVFRHTRIAVGENGEVRDIAIGVTHTACATALGAVEGADALVLMTEWREFRRPDFARLKSIMRTPVIFDGRNVWDPTELRALGFTYYGVGRP